MFTTDQWLTWRQNDTEFHGRGYIAGEPNPDPEGIDGIVTINDVPGAREIEIRERTSRRVVAVGFSNADGTYRFDGLNPDIEFDVISRDWSRTYTDVIVPARKPTPY